MLKKAHQRIPLYLFYIQEHLKNHHTFKIYSDLLKSQWSDLSGIHKIALSNLISFLKFTNNNSSYYQKIFDKYKFFPDKIKQISDLSALPFLDKKIIQSNYDGIQSKNSELTKIFKTGGSSGEPLMLPVGLNRISHDIAAKMRARYWWDIEVGDPEWVIWGSPIECQTQSFFKKIRDWLLNSSLIPARGLGESEIKAILHNIILKRPRAIISYPSVLSLMADVIEKNDIDLRAARLKVAFVTSEVLDEFTKRKIQSKFHCPLANEYGGRDFGFLAHSCPHGNMHISAEDIIVEIIDKDGQILPHGQIGEIVVTHCRTQAFPIVRYKTGDFGAISYESCPCGIGLPILTELDGRQSDLLVSIDGKAIHRAELLGILVPIIEKHRFQFIQKSKDKAILKLQCTEFPDESKKTISASLHKLFGPTFTTQIELVDFISPEQNGKYKFVKNESLRN